MFFKGVKYAFSPSIEKGTCSSHTKAELRRYRKSYQKLPGALSLGGADVLEGFRGSTNAGGVACMMYGEHTTAQLQP